jgi:hypothetical protein
MSDRAYSMQKSVGNCRQSQARGICMRIHALVLRSFLREDRHHNIYCLESVVTLLHIGLWRWRKRFYVRIKSELRHS